MQQITDFVVSFPVDISKLHSEWHSKVGSSVVECLSQDLGVAGLSLTGITALCP